MWASSDLDKFSPASAPLLLTKGTTTAVPESSGGLSTGTITGIGVGVGVLCLALIALLVALLFMRRRKAKRRAEEQGKGIREAYQQYHYPDSPALEPLNSPPGYESRRGTGGQVFAKYAEENESPESPSELSGDLSSEKRVRRKPVPATRSELDVTESQSNQPSTTVYEVDGNSPVYEMHGNPIERFNTPRDEVSALGLAPGSGAARDAYRGTAGRSSTNTSSSENGLRPPQINANRVSGTLQGRWADYDPGHYYNQR